MIFHGVVFLLILLITDDMLVVMTFSDDVKLAILIIHQLILRLQLKKSHLRNPGLYIVGVLKEMTCGNRERQITIYIYIYTMQQVQCVACASISSFF